MTSKTCAILLILITFLICIIGMILIPLPDGVIVGTGAMMLIVTTISIVAIHITG